MHLGLYYIFAACFLYSLPWWESVAFTPQTFSSNSHYEQKIINFILSAQSSVKVIYTQTFSDQDIADALNNRATVLGAANIKLIKDDVAITSVTLNSGIVIKTDNDPNAETHAKLIIVDGGTPNAKLLLMSSNLNDPSFSSHDNTLLIIKNASITNWFNTEFEEMWARTFHNTNDNVNPAMQTFSVGNKGATVRCFFNPDHNSMESGVTNNAVSSNKIRYAVKNAMESILYNVYTFGSSAVDGSETGGNSLEDTVAYLKLTNASIAIQ